MTKYRETFKRISRSCLVLAGLGAIVATSTPQTALAEVTTPPATTQVDIHATALGLLEREIQVAREHIGDAAEYRTNTVEEVKKEIKRQKDEGLYVYVVQWGDELDVLAEATDQKVEDLAKFNRLNPEDDLTVGSVLLGVIHPEHRTTLNDRLDHTIESAKDKIELGKEKVDEIKAKEKAKDTKEKIEDNLHDIGDNISPPATDKQDQLVPDTPETPKTPAQE